jgi:hypothetical protein
MCSTTGGSPQSSDPLEVETELAEAEPEPTEEGKSNPSHALSSPAASFRKPAHGYTTRTDWTTGQTEQGEKEYNTSRQG